MNTGKEQSPVYESLLHIFIKLNASLDHSKYERSVVKPPDAVMPEQAYL